MGSYLALEKMLLLLCADLAIIVASARIFGWLFGKLGQPPVVGEILADLAISGATAHPISLFDPLRLVTT